MYTFESFCLDGIVNQVRVSDRTPLMSILLSGPPGCGRTALAAHLASTCGFPFAKMITPDQLIGYSERGKIDKIHKVFEDAVRYKILFLDFFFRFTLYQKKYKKFYF